MLDGGRVERVASGDTLFYFTFGLHRSEYQSVQKLTIRPPKPCQSEGPLRIADPSAPSGFTSLPNPKSGFVRAGSVDENRQLQCAGINRHEVEDERALRERNSDPLGLESCAGYREVHSEA